MPSAGAPQGVWGSRTCLFPWGVYPCSSRGAHCVFWSWHAELLLPGHRAEGTQHSDCSRAQGEGALSIYFCCFSFQDEIKLQKENPSLLLQRCISASLEGKTLARRFSCTLLVPVSPLSSFRTLTPGQFPAHRVWCFGVCFFFFLCYCFQSISQ